MVSRERLLGYFLYIVYISNIMEIVQANVTVVLSIEELRSIYIYTQSLGLKGKFKSAAAISQR